MTKSIQLIANKNVQLVLDTQSTLLKDLETKNSQIEKLWKKALSASKGELFNASLCFLSRIKKETSMTTLFVSFAEYRYYRAQHDGLDLGLIPIGVSGIILAEYRGKIFVPIAKRSPFVTQYPGAFELVPSGGVDNHALTDTGKLEPLKNLEKEFEEETGLSCDMIDSTQLLAVVKDTNDNVIDLCFCIKISISPEVFRSAISDCAEYEDVMLVTLEELADMMTSAAPNEVVPTSRILAEIVINSNNLCHK